MSKKSKSSNEKFFLSFILLYFLIILSCGSLYATVPEDQTVQGETVLWADTNIPNPNVWVVIHTPDCREIKKTLIFNRNRYEITFDFDYPGHYKVVTSFQDQNGQVYNKTTNYTAMDAFEPDDSPQQATFVPIQDEINHFHNFHGPDNEDWIVFLLLKEGEREVHQIRIEKIEEWDVNCSGKNQWDSECPLIVDLCHLDGNLVLDPNRQPVLCNQMIYEPVAYYPEDIFIYIHSYKLPHSDFYLLRFYYGCKEIPSETSTSYNIRKIYVPSAAAGTGHILGHIKDEKNNPVPGWIHFEREDSNTDSLPNDPNGGNYFGIDLDEGSYKVYASATCYQDSPKYDVRVEKDSLTQLNIFLCKDQNDPNCKVPQPGSVYPSKISKKILRLTFHTGMNLFKGQCDVPNYNSDSLIDNVYLSLKNFYGAINLPFNVSMGIKGHDPNRMEWYGHFMDGSETTYSCDGETFTIDKDKTYLFYLDIQDPNQNLKEVSLLFYCPRTPPNIKEGYNFYKGINLSGLSGLFRGHISFQRLLENPNIKDKISSILFYDNQKGSFHSCYNIFGRLFVDNSKSITNNGYIIYAEEAVHVCKP